MPCTGRKVRPITPNSLVEPPLHFFKVILPTTLAEKKLRIPESFVNRFRDELSAVAKLSVPNGHVWQVGLTIDGENIWFQESWHDFVQYYSISIGYFLVFKYAKNSTFQVLIFDKTACEIQYPYNAQEAVNDEQAEIKNKPRSNVKNSKVRPANNKFKMEEMYDFFSSLEKMGIYIAGKHRLPSIKQRKRAIDIARFFKPRKPSVMFIFQQHCLREHTNLPIKFASKYISSKARHIILQISDVKEWLVQIQKLNTGGFRLTKGWTGFLKDCGLKGGDICIFEPMIRKKNHLTLKVSVFHAAMELTCLKCCELIA